MNESTLLKDTIKGGGSFGTTEGELKESLRKYENIIGSISDVVFETDKDGTVTYVNNAIKDFLGKEPQQVIGSRFHKWIDKDALPQAIARFQQILSGQNITYASTVIDDKGRKRFVEVKSFPIMRDNRVIGIRGSLRDITERKQAEDALQESERRMKSIFLASPVGIGLIVNRVMLEVNERFCRMTGYSPEELIGKDALFIYPTREEYEFVGREKYAQIRERGTGTVETKWRRKDGAIIDILLSSTALDMKDLSRGVIFTALDITERKRAAKVLETQKEELEQKNIALNEILVQIEIEKNKIKKQVAANVEALLLPIIKKLSVKGASRKYLHLLEHNLKELTSSFGLKITERRNKLTPKEIEICNMIKSGFSSKDIAGILNISLLTVNKHRRNIREKLGMSRKNINLTSFLRTI